MIAVITPTYNEKDNINILLSRLERTLKDVDYRIIVIDDNSPDGTGQIIKERQTTNDRIILIERTGKLGLGTALRTGIKRAYDLGAGRIIQMDADLSHPPESIIEMLAVPEDVVIGSRYVRGGKLEGWAWYRKLLSWGANWLAHVTTGLVALDATGGFRCFKRQVFDRVRLDSITSEGYSHQMELLWRCQQAGLSIREIPITFTNRTRGSSKISSKEVWRAISTMWRIVRWRFGLNKTE